MEHALVNSGGGIPQVVLNDQGHASGQFERITPGDRHGRLLVTLQFGEGAKSACHHSVQDFLLHQGAIAFHIDLRHQFRRGLRAEFLQGLLDFSHDFVDHCLGIVSKGVVARQDFVEFFE